MHRFFAERIDAQTARLSPQEARHAATVLRLKAGEKVQLIMEDQLFDAELTCLTPEGQARLLGPLPSPEPSLKITLFQGLPKADKVDWIVQKGTEAGIDGFRLIEMDRSVSRLKDADAARKAERWQRIAQEAAKQSGRAHVPSVRVITWQKALAELGACDIRVIPWEEEKTCSLNDIAVDRETRTAGLVIGPEGGITPEEIGQARSAGAVPVTLGPRIFRTETAGLAAAVILLNRCGAYGPTGGD